MVFLLETLRPNFFNSMTGYFANFTVIWHKKEKDGHPLKIILCEEKNRKNG